MEAGPAHLPWSCPSLHLRLAASEPREDTFLLSVPSVLRGTLMDS